MVENENPGIVIINGIFVNILVTNPPKEQDQIGPKGADTVHEVASADWPIKGGDNGEGEQNEHHNHENKHTINAKNKPGGSTKFLHYYLNRIDFQLINRLQRLKIPAFLKAETFNIFTLNVSLYKKIALPLPSQI